MIFEILLPGADLLRGDVVVLGDLLDALLALEHLGGDAGFELGGEKSSLAVHHSDFGVIRPSQTSKSFNKMLAPFCGTTSEISFLGRRWEITPGDTKLVTIVHQPGSFRVISRPPTPQAPQWPDILAEYSL